MRLGRAFARPAEAAIAAREDGGDQRGQLVARRLLRHHAFDQHQCALLLALVVDADDAFAADHVGRGRQGLVNLQPLLAVHHHEEIDARQERAFAAARAGPAARDHGREGRHHLQIVLIGEGEFVLVHRVALKAHAQRVEDDVAVVVARLEPDRLGLYHFVVVDRHRHILSCSGARH